MEGLNSTGYPSSNNVEEYDGSSWTEIAATNPRYAGLGGGALQTAGFIAGGSNGPSTLNKTELYDGTNWVASGGLKKASAAPA